MALYRENDRLECDSRILKITDIDEASLWLERSKLNIRGLICDYPSLSKLNKATKDMVELSKNYNSNRKKTARKWDYAHNEKNITSESDIKNGMSEDVNDVVKVLAEIYRRAIGIDIASALVIVNNRNERATKRHQDRGVSPMVCTFNQAGTICENEYGKEYAVEAGKILLIDNTIWHRAPPQEESWKNNPRVNSIVYSRN